MVRLVINSGRSVIVWAISLAIGWQTFQPLQIVGFLIMSLGVLIFNDILLGRSSLCIRMCIVCRCINNLSRTSFARSTSSVWLLEGCGGGEH